MASTLVRVVNSDAQERRHRPHPASRQQGRSGRVAPGRTRREHRRIGTGCTAGFPGGRLH
ncbi:hypothetical protein X962_5847 [Burkholderia pseudomallei MSHR7343]|nr:hypothetical protein X962_5847 [Burkholderia pseudomallei MSHR7343]